MGGVNLLPTVSSYWILMSLFAVTADVVTVTLVAVPLAIVTAPAAADTQEPLTLAQFEVVP
jgi:hypothetical protein